MDLTKEAQYICQGVQTLSARDDVTLLHLGEILKGSMNAKIVEKKHNQLEMHAKMAKYKKNDIERFLRKLIFGGHLKEEIKILAHSDTVVSYIKLGPRAHELLNAINPNRRIEFELFDDEPGSSKSKPKLDFKTIDSNTVKLNYKS